MYEENILFNKKMKTYHLEVDGGCIRQRTVDA